jgi:murein DD-endopeptidase MepM/ murein hydrolase activator NlpD
LRYPWPPGSAYPGGWCTCFDLSRDPDIPGIPSVVRIAPTEVSRHDAVVVDAPLSGERWVDLNGCCAELTDHRRAPLVVNGQHILAQRFANDFVPLTPDGRLSTGAPDQLASYRFYGTNVTAVDSGVVVKAQDGVPDNVPFNPPPIDITLKTLPGNYVVVDIGGGHFAGYAHLVPGSLTVGVGDRVRRGQVLGHLGNSGNSDLPHLHFQMTDGPLFLGSDGLPYQIRSFDSEGTIANGDDLFGGAAATTDPALAGQHRRQLPLDLEVVSFPANQREN